MITTTLDLPKSADSHEKDQVLKDLWICLISRETSNWGRREVLTGKAKFGIMGGGKELPQVVMAKYLKKGDYRSGYYRDQTLMLALDLMTVKDFFAQLYADPEHDKFSGGRQMDSHFATPFIDENDNWVSQQDQYNISSDISPTGGQMARAVGLAFASKVYRNINFPDDFNLFTNDGNEIVHCTIGDASTSEGVFWETLNAASVKQIPMLVSVWDDGYGISVPKEIQTVKESISKALEGFTSDDNGVGLDIYRVQGWDYAALNNVYDRAAQKTRKDHSPGLVHVVELTQPQGHSTSGSHERYKTDDRLEWEKEYDCIEQFAQWIIRKGLATEEEISQMRKDAKKHVKEEAKKAWNKFGVVRGEVNTRLKNIIEEIDVSHGLLAKLVDSYKKIREPRLYEVTSIARQLKTILISTNQSIPSALFDLLRDIQTKADDYYHSHLYGKSNQGDSLPDDQLLSEDEFVNGYEQLNLYFDHLFSSNPAVLAFGEDVGHIGGVNQGFADLQEKFGKDRIFDTGIREWTIVGGAIGLAMRGLKPIAEIQYLDYIMYALSALTDDLATIRYRSNNLQKAPAIIRTRGHRLEGIWHAGSHLGMLVNSLRGMHICVPRDMIRAVGMYNTLIEGNDPALLIEVLNGYRHKERKILDPLHYKIPLGIPETIHFGNDITVVTYGACIRIVMDAVKRLRIMNIHVECIDVQTLLPFDTQHLIVESVKKTNRLLVVDEDVPGGASAYILSHILEDQNAYRYLDAKPTTLTSKAHRTPFGSDGDYFTKPNVEDVVEKIMEMVSE